MLWRNPTTQISLAIIIQLCYRFQDNHMSGHSRREDPQLWFVISSTIFQVTCQHLGASCSVVMKRTSLGHHIQLKFRCCAYLPNQFHWSPTKKISLTFQYWIWPLPQDIDLRWNFAFWHFYVSMHIRLAAIFELMKSKSDTPSKCEVSGKTNPAKFQWNRLTFGAASSPL